MRSAHSSLKVRTRHQYESSLKRAFMTLCKHVKCEIDGEEVNNEIHISSSSSAIESG